MCTVLGLESDELLSSQWLDEFCIHANLNDFKKNNSHINELKAKRLDATNRF
jgi:hypothetical protein